MTEADRQHGPRSFWDQRYGSDDYLFGIEPNDFIRAVVPPAGAGASAFAPADGEGRNGVWLARLGYSVTSIDISPVAVEKALALAEQAGVTIDARAGDVMEISPQDGPYDVIVVSFMHFHVDAQTRFHRMLAELLAPGGLLVLEGYHRDQADFDSGGPKDAEMLFDRNQIARDFESLDIVLLQDCRRMLAEGTRHRGEAATVQLVARKSRQ